MWVFCLYLWSLSCPLSLGFSVCLFSFSHRKNLWHTRAYFLFWIFSFLSTRKQRVRSELLFIHSAVELFEPKLEVVGVEFTSSLFFHRCLGDLVCCYFGSFSFNLLFPHPRYVLCFFHSDPYSLSLFFSWQLKNSFLSPSPTRPSLLLIKVVSLPLLPFSFSFQKFLFPSNHQTTEPPNEVLLCLRSIGLLLFFLKILHSSLWFVVSVSSSGFLVLGSVSL